MLTGYMAESPLAPKYHPDFHADRKKLGLSGPNFNYFFADVEGDIVENPWRYTFALSDGIRMRLTRNAYLDIPPLRVYYRAEGDPPKIEFLGLRPAWSTGEVV